MVLGWWCFIRLLLPVLQNALPSVDCLLNSSSLTSHGLTERHNISLLQTERDPPGLVISVDGPAFVGEATNVTLRVAGLTANVTSFEFMLWLNNTKIKHNWITTDDYVVLSLQEWKEVGLKQVYGAAILHVANDSFVIENNTKISVAGTFDVCIRILQHGKNMSCCDSKCVVHEGLATVAAAVMDKRGFLLKSNLTYKWHMSESNNSQVAHGRQFLFNFTQLGSMKFHLKAIAQHNGVMYMGKSSSNVAVKVIWVKGILLVWQNPTPGSRLPLGEQILGTGPTHLLANVTHRNPSFDSAVIICYWNFGDGQTATTTSVQTSHNYTSSGTKYASVTVAIYYMHKSYEARLKKTIMLEDKVRGIQINAPPTIVTGRNTEIIINCTGSAPVSFCWFISKDNCHRRHTVICSPTLVSSECHAVIDHVFDYAGPYCINVTVINGVGSTGVHREFRVVTGAHHGSRAIVVLTLVLLGISLSIVVVIVTLMVKRRKHARRRKLKKTEVATFDFRESVSFEQARLSTSLPSADCKHSCPLWCFSCRRFSDDYPYQDQSAMFTTSPIEPLTPRRKVSYYGAVHMGLLQQHNRSVVPDVAPVTEEDELQIFKGGMMSRPKSI